jgi:hypothetical protein
MKRSATVLIGVVLVVMLFACGCGGSGGDSAGPSVPVATADLSGTLTVPTTLNSNLLADVNLVQNTDSVVRTARASAVVSVNDQVMPAAPITPAAAVADWDFRIRQVPQSSTGLYKVEVTVGKVGLKAWIKEAQRESFQINSRTTAGALLAKESGQDAAVLLASYSALVGDIARQIEAAYRFDKASMTTDLFSLALIKNEVASQTAFLKDNTGFDPSAMVANLKLQNDLDGDGNIDLQIARTTDGTRVRFFTELSSATSMFDQIGAVGSYADARLLEDFSTGNTSNTRTFDSQSRSFALGLYFKKSARSDIYLKLFVKKIDLVEGSFRGVVAEYQYVTATSTAIATGTKTFTLAAQAPTQGTVAGSDFLTDGPATATTLCFVDSAKGLGSSDSSVRLVRAVDGKPALADLTFAEPYQAGGTNYHPNTTAALGGIFKNRGIQVGDVFSAYFASNRTYALFKVTEITATTVTVDYKVNRSPDEYRF